MRIHGVVNGPVTTQVVPLAVCCRRQTRLRRLHLCVSCISILISYLRTYGTNLAHVSTHRFRAEFARISRIDSSQFGSDQFSSSQCQNRSTSARGGDRTAMSSAWCGTHLPTGLQRERHSHRGDDGRVLQNNTAAAGSAIRNEQPTWLNRALHVVQNVQPLIPTPSPTPKPCTRNRSAFTH